MAYAEQFQSELVSCNEILSAGSILLVGNLVNCGDEPTVYTISNSTAIAIAATTASLQVTVPAATASVRLRKGSLHHFGANTIQIAEEAVVTNTATTVAIEPATAAIAINTLATTWGLLRILAPTTLPLNSESTTQSTNALSQGIQGSSVKTKVMLKSDLEVIASPQDRAFEQVVFPASQGTQDIYVVAVQGTGAAARVVFGRAKVNSMNMQAGNDDFLKYSFALDFQSPYAISAIWMYETSAKQTALNAVRALSGLAQLSV